MEYNLGYLRNTLATIDNCPLTNDRKLSEVTPTVNFLYNQSTVDDIRAT